MFKHFLPDGKHIMVDDPSASYEEVEAWARENLPDSYATVQQEEEETPVAAAEGAEGDAAADGEAAPAADAEKK